jgi:hypothetical protein
MTTDPNHPVDILLALHGLQPAPGDRETIAAMYDVFRPGVDALYALPEARYEVPALVFVARPPLQEW